MGKENAAIFSALAATAKFKGKITYSGVSGFDAAAKAYEANYIASTLRSGGALTSFLPKYDRSLKCKTPTRYIISGYSQGAYEVRKGLQRLYSQSGNAALIRRISAVVLIGDPAKAGTGILRVPSERTITLATKSSLQWAAKTCSDITAQPWPYPDCLYASLYDPFTGPPNLVTPPNGVVIPSGVMETLSTAVIEKAPSRMSTGIVSELSAKWDSLRNLPDVPSPWQPTFTYDVAGDGIARGTEVVSGQFQSTVDIAKTIFTDPNYPSRYTRTVQVLSAAFLLLERAKQVHNSYTATPTMAQSVSSWLVRTVK